MKSKISFGTAIFHNPKYLLLDEPFDGIDENFKPKIIEALKKISSEGGSILITSHDHDILYSLCDYTLKLEDGKIINSDET
jgi:ABC-type multidrug transport system ATPase subunit